VHFTSLAASDSNSVTITWFGRLNWYYAVQYVDSLGPDSLWMVLPGCTNILGQDAEIQRTDNTMGGLLNRYYRIISY
jgi:hypothetical protein